MKVTLYKNRNYQIEYDPEPLPQLIISYPDNFVTFSSWFSFMSWTSTWNIFTTEELRIITKNMELAQKKLRYYNQRTGKNKLENNNLPKTIFTINKIMEI